MFEDFRLSTIDTAQASVRVRHGGSGPPLPLLHGSPQTHVMWHLLAPRLAEDSTVIAADLRGYGDSSKPETAPDHEPYSKRTMALDQVEVMKHLGFERFAHIRHHHLGEGEYKQSEMVIQRLLAEAGIGGNGHELVSVDARGAEAAADWDNLRSPENYVGYERTANFASPGGAVLDGRRVYDASARLRLNQWALSGDWTVERQAAVLNRPNGRIAHRFHARDLHLVMGPAARGTSVRFRVLIDGQPPAAAHGIDVDDQGNGTVSEQRLYQLIRQPKPIADRHFEIEFLDPGVEAYAFTFG